MACRIFFELARQPYAVRMIVMILWNTGDLLLSSLTYACACLLAYLLILQTHTQTHLIRHCILCESGWYGMGHSSTTRFCHLGVATLLAYVEILHGKFPATNEFVWL
jgi:hypothetical protein